MIGYEPALTNVSTFFGPKVANIVCMVVKSTDRKDAPKAFSYSLPYPIRDGKRAATDFPLPLFPFLDYYAYFCVQNPSPAEG